MEEKSVDVETTAVYTDFQSSLMENLRKKDFELRQNFQKKVDSVSSPKRESVAAVIFQVQRANEILKHLGQHHAVSGVDNAIDHITQGMD